MIICGVVSVVVPCIVSGVVPVTGVFDTRCVFGAQGVVIWIGTE